tara:strand:- start:397 stop:1296 length:900 start_codon:yes stop_codon:yes gene_type:complete
MIPYILTNNSLTAVIKGKSLTMEKDNPAFSEAVKLIHKAERGQEDWGKLEGLFDTGRAVEDYSEGNVSVKDGEVFYKGEAVHGHVVGRILDLMGSEKPYKPVIRFLDKLMENPSRRSINELYAFLEHKAMPLTPDGNFLAYKGVRDDYTDWHSGKFRNKVGDEHEMIRNKVCDDANIGCSYGFHAGSLEYAKGYGNGGHLMVVEINPADVVSVPNDCDQQKLRTSKYKVVAHFERKLEEPLCDEYGDYDDYYDLHDAGDDNDCEDSSYDEGYNEGYNQAMKTLSKKFGRDGSSTKVEID